MEPPAWEAADRFSVIDVPQADVLVLGLCERFAYGILLHDGERVQQTAPGLFTVPVEMLW